MELVTDDIRATLLENGSRYRQDADFDSMPVVKFFTPDASASWLIVSADPEDPFVLFGLCRIQHKPNRIKPLRVIALRLCRPMLWLLFGIRYPICI
ncbi:DUF2958 domain-containing protein [Allomesorhizobium alhagi]|uniref:Uncharacterized protein n=1 Tax=Mesorhizobium alhagi CCNWXJ12-2 TaxID=1107882 RepID=H0I184_9HYPH|nr:DUF2958 domain-containing protein [Mesorhizobium alhagi]EHK53246.1 hypothetical protein MAXJ12_31107 [Mesorhizobium alhagi CCNWXJ12-2]